MLGSGHLAVRVTFCTFLKDMTQLELEKKLA